MTAPAASGPGAAARIESLDFLRGVAILMVAVYHFFGVTYARDSLPWRGLWPNWALADAVSFAWLYPLRLGGNGVILFFVLSGFCIHYSVLRQQERGEWNGWRGPLAFYWRRFFRIVPPYYAAIAVAMLWRPPGGWIDLLAHLTFTHTLFAERSIAYGINPNFWTLAIEWQLYLLYPFIVVLRRYTNAAVMLLVCVGVMLLMRYEVRIDVGPLTSGRSPMHYWLEWVGGAYVADCWYHRRRPAFRLGWWLLVPLGALWLGTAFYRPLAVQAWWIRALFFLVAVDRVAAGSHPRGRLYHVMSRVGLVSYSMYLLHTPVMWLFRPLWTRLGVIHEPMVMFGLCLPIYLALTYWLSKLSYRWVEVPSIAWGRRLWDRCVVRWA